MGILDTLKKAIDSAGKAASKFTVQDLVKSGQGVVDKAVQPVFQSFYDASQKRLDLEERARQSGTPVTGLQKALSYVPGVAMATNQRIEGELKANDEGRAYSATDRLIDTTAGIAKAGAGILPVAYVPATVAAGAVGQLTEKLTGKNLVDALSAAAASGSENIVRKAVDKIPGLTDEQREKASVGGGEFLKFAAELVGARLGGKVAEGKGAAVKLTKEQAAAAERFGLKAAEVESFASQAARPAASPVRSVLGQAAGMTAADLALAQAGKDGEGESGVRTSLAAAAANVFPGGKGKKGKPDVAETVRKTKVVDPDAPEAAVVAKSFAKEDAARKASMPFKDAQAKIELAAEKAIGVVSPTRSNPAYAEFWKSQDAAKAVAAPKKDSAPTEDDYYSAVEAPEDPAPIKAMLDKAIESKKKPAEPVIESTKSAEPSFAPGMKKLATSRVNYGKKPVTFKSDLDKAAYIVSGSDRSGSHADIVEYARQFTKDSFENTEQYLFDRGQAIKAEMRAEGLKTDDAKPYTFNGIEESAIKPTGETIESLRAKAEAKKAAVESERKQVVTDEEFPGKDFRFSKNMEKVAPRWGQKELKFESDLDRAAYMASGDGQSKSHARVVEEFSQWAKVPKAQAEAILRSHGRRIKDGIKEMGVKTNEPGVVNIPAYFQVPKAQQPAPVRTDRQVVSAALNKAVAARKPKTEEPSVVSEAREVLRRSGDATALAKFESQLAAARGSTLPEGSVAKKAVDDGFAKYDAEVAAEKAAAKEAPVAPFETEIVKPDAPKMANYEPVKSLLSDDPNASMFKVTQDKNGNDVKNWTFRKVKGAVSMLGALSSRVAMNKVRVADANGVERGLGDVQQAMIEARAPEAAKLVEASGLGTDLDFAVKAYRSYPEKFSAALDSLIAAMRSSKLRDVKVGEDASNFTYGTWADILESERGSNDRSYIPFGNDVNAVRDLAVLDAAIARLKNGPSQANTALRRTLGDAEPLVRDTMLDLSIAAQNAGKTLGQAGGDFLVSKGKLRDYEIDSGYKHDYVPEKMFEEHKKRIESDASVDKATKDAIKNLTYQQFQASGVKPDKLDAGTLDALSPILKEKLDAKHLHMPGDLARVIHQADRLAAIKQNQAAFDLGQAAAASEAGSAVNKRSVGSDSQEWQGALRGMLGLGDANVSRQVAEGPGAWSKMGDFASRYVSPYIMFGRLKPLLQAAYTSVASIPSTAMSNPKGFFGNLVNMARVAKEVSSNAPFTDALQRYGIIERNVDSRASKGDKLRDAAFQFGGKFFDQQGKKLAALAAISEMAGKSLTPDQAAKWLHDKVNNGSSSQRATLLSDLTSLTTRMSDHTSGSRSTRATLRNPLFSMLKSYSRNSFGRAVNGVQNAIDAFNNRSKTGSYEAYRRAASELSYPLAMYVGGPLVAFGVLKAISEANGEDASDEVLMEQAFNTYNMSLADGSADTAINQAVKEAFGLVSPSGLTSLVDNVAGLVRASGKAYDGDFQGAGAELLKSASFGRFLDDSFGRDERGNLRFDKSVTGTLGLPTSSQAAEKLARGEFARQEYGAKDNVTEALKGSAKSFLGRTIGDLVTGKLQTTGAQEEAAEIADAKGAAAKDLVAFMDSGNKVSFRQYLENIMPESVKYDPAEFASLMYSRTTGKAIEGTALADIMDAMPQSYRDPAYVGDFGKYLRDLKQNSPESLQVIAEAIARPIAEHAFESRKTKDPNVKAKFTSVSAPTAATAQAVGGEEFATDASYKLSVLGGNAVKDANIDGDWEAAADKLNSLVSRYQADKGLWESVGPSISRAISQTVMGENAQQLLDLMRKDGASWPALYDALSGRLKYLSGPAGDAMYSGEKPEAAAETTGSAPAKTGTKKPTDITSLLNSAIWSASEKKGDKKSKPYVPVPTSKKSASRPSTRSASSPSGRISEALYKAIGSRPRK